MSLIRQKLYIFFVEGTTGIRNDTGGVRSDKNEKGGWVIDTHTKVQERGRTDMKNGPNKQRKREKRKAALEGAV